jgi:hypothetical protein
MFWATSVIAKHLPVSDSTTRLTRWPPFVTATEICLLVVETPVWKVSSGADAPAAVTSDAEVP